MKRILFVLRNLLGGGIERVALTLARELKRQGHDVHMLLQRDRVSYAVDPDLDLEVLDVERARRRTASGLVHSALAKGVLRHVLPRSEFVWWGEAYRSAFERWLDDFERRHGALDLILVRGIGAFKYLWRVRRPNLYFSVHITPFLMDPHRSRPLVPYFAALHRRLFHDRELIAVSDALRAMVLEHSARAGAVVRSIRTIHNPCDLEAVRAQAEEPLEGVDGPFVLTVGRLVEQKRHDLLLRAFARAGLDGRLVLLGEGPEQPRLERLAGRLGLTGRVLFPGFDPNPFRWMRRARLFALSSDFEGFGNVLVEALASGTSVVSTDCPCGPAEILTGELARGLVPVGDVEALAARMIDLYRDPLPGAPHHVERFALPRIAAAYAALPPHSA